MIGRCLGQPGTHGALRQPEDCSGWGIRVPFSSARPRGSLSGTTVKRLWLQSAEPYWRASRQEGIRRLLTP